MAEIMCALGDFIFSMDAAQYDQLQSNHAWRWAKRDRLARKPAKAYQGPDASAKTFNITIYPEKAADLAHFPNLKALGDSGTPHRLVAGGTQWLNGATVPAGADLGLWVVDGLQITDSEFMGDGTPLKQTGTLSISEYGDDEV
ncbi:phage tail protein [Pontibacterium sp.]|uniref:phage tail protein n=1 Tax=Pontibacterium sp. TaxID=2036026 RepID=UPI003561FF43